MQPVPRVTPVPAGCQPRQDPKLRRGRCERIVKQIRRPPSSSAELIAKLHLPARCANNSSFELQQQRRIEQVEADCSRGSKTSNEGISLLFGKQSAQPRHAGDHGCNDEFPGHRQETGEHREQALLRGHCGNAADDQRGKTILGDLVATTQSAYVSPELNV